MLTGESCIEFTPQFYFVSEDALHLSDVGQPYDMVGIEVAVAFVFANLLRIQ